MEDSENNMVEAVTDMVSSINNSKKLVASENWGKESTPWKVVRMLELDKNHASDILNCERSVGVRRIRFDEELGFGIIEESMGEDDSDGDAMTTID